MSPWSFYRGKRYWRQFHQYPFEFNDSFGLTLSAVFPSPKLCDPGPGSWLVTDTASRMSQAAGKLTYATDPTPGWDRCILVSTLPFLRRAGMYFECEFTPTNVEYTRMGWHFVNAASSTGTGANGQIAYNEATIYLAGSQMILVTDGLDVVSPLYPYNTGTSYTFRVYDTGAGWLYYVCPTASLPNGWVLLWERFRSFTRDSRHIPALNNHGLTGTMTHCFVRQGLVKAPVAAAVQPSQTLVLAGAADGLVDAEIKAVGNDTRQLVFRASDANNYWAAVMNTQNNTFALTKTVAGVTTTVANTGVSWQVGQYYRIRALTFANHIRIFWGIQGPVYTDDSFNQTALLFGANPPGAAVGNFVDGDLINLRCQTGGHLLLN